ncbi:hypothetical protein GO496_04025 [Acidovorax citrulli]|nr:hypothetical protein [Paracidovorax citrulli]
MALADITALLDDLARDQGSILAPEARVRALEAARLQYSSDHPRALPEDLTWLSDSIGPNQRPGRSTPGSSRPSTPSAAIRCR